MTPSTPATSLKGAMKWCLVLLWVAGGLGGSRMVGGSVGEGEGELEGEERGGVGIGADGVAGGR